MTCTLDFICYKKSVFHKRSFIFFFNDTATTKIYTLSLHDALPICAVHVERGPLARGEGAQIVDAVHVVGRSEEHTSELQSRLHLVCRLLLEKKKIIIIDYLN